MAETGGGGGSEKEGMGKRIFGEGRETKRNIIIMRPNVVV